MRHLALLVMAAAAGGAAGQVLADAPARPTFGRLERVKIVEATPIEVPARLDEGGDQTSLYASDIKYFAGEGGTWVTFTVENGEAVPNRQVTFKVPLLRDQHVKERTGGIAHRPVVKLNLCVGTTALETEVGVVERTTYTPPLVFSRADLDRLGAVDTHKQYLAGDPNCRPPPPPPQASQE